MKKVLVIGGSGTIGSAFIREFYDDYAHHPTEIRELLKGVKKQKSNNKLAIKR